uniref:Uncharacterized protein n=1 Tax=Caenorhabditis japonica TaxID=281687 RepID=A0A8R1DZK4_CAEJA
MAWIQNIVIVGSASGLPLEKLQKEELHEKKGDIVGLVGSWDGKGVIYKELLPDRTDVDADLYCRQLQKMKDQHAVHWPGTNDNARPYVALATKDTLQALDVEEKRVPISNDLMEEEDDVATARSSPILRDGETDDVADGAENIKSEYGTPTRENCTIENSLYSKCHSPAHSGAQQLEIDRLESQNAEYREKLLRTIRERDLNEELLKNVQKQHKKELEAQSRRIREFEVQMKANSDRATAQEAHFNVTTREMTAKFNKELQQATKKADTSDKEKNEAVVKYAMREGEMMKLREEIKIKESGLKECKDELEAVKKLQSQENVDALEKCVNSLKVEIEKLKHEKFDVENRMKIAEKRVETLTTNVAESKQQCDVLRKQLIRAKEEKVATCTADLERRLQESDNNLERLRTSHHDMASKFEESSRENADLLAKIDILQDTLSLEEDRRRLCEQQIERLRGVESFVESSSHRIEESQKERATAEQDREQAEQEAKECREQAEKMLRLTQELTDRNMELQWKCKAEEEKNLTLTSKIEELEAELRAAYETSKTFEDRNQELLEQISSLQLEISKPVTLESLEENFYRDKLEDANRKLEEIEAKWTEDRNSFAAYKKKTNASMKELRAELSRKTGGGGTQNGDGHVLMPPPVSSEPSISDRSRTSSITSIDRVTSTSDPDESKQQEQQKNMQQIMIDKIVILQRKLARRTEKCEFLEEHVRQCLEELQKKTKIIQHFALREEASLLMPSDASLEKVPILRKSSAYALMGAMFTASGGEKKQSQVLTEVNSRLQAVLEDVIQKNIGMRKKRHRKRERERVQRKLWAEG